MEVSTSHGCSQADFGLEYADFEDGLDHGPFDRSRRRCSPYASLALSHEPENCPDLRYVYEQQYEMHIQRGAPKDGYHQFKSAAGQLARFAVATEVVEVEQFARPGGLFQLTISSDLVRGFIGGFQNSEQPSTVSAEATLLVRLCRFARQYFGKIPGARTPSILAHIDKTANILSRYCRVEKATSRRQTAVLRDQNRRETFIERADWERLEQHVNDDMSAVSTGLTELMENLGENIH
jgi:hypothetical protein